MRVKRICLCGLFSALLCLCSWLCIPVGNLVFTLQTFAALLTLGLLGGKWGTASIGVYLALGAVGLPVFSGFRGGVGMLLGATGGFLWGFLVAGLVYWGAHYITKRTLFAMLSALVACYAVGAVWYRAFYFHGSFGAALAVCVAPYLLPDAVKLGLALFLTKRLRRLV
ncbi:MAG: biotin transporter BioY [Oscillospiraceae bacterium]|nr:biotin transporter BioY [Oscillospiraceae bacterium]